MVNPGFSYHGSNLQEGISLLKSNNYGLRYNAEAYVRENPHLRPLLPERVRSTGAGWVYIPDASLSQLEEQLQALEQEQSQLRLENAQLRQILRLQSIEEECVILRSRLSSAEAESASLRTKSVIEDSYLGFDGIFRVTLTSPTLSDGRNPVVYALADIDQRKDPDALAPECQLIHRCTLGDLENAVIQVNGAIYGPLGCLLRHPQVIYRRSRAYFEIAHFHGSTEVIVGFKLPPYIARAWFEFIGLDYDTFLGDPEAFDGTVAKTKKISEMIDHFGAGTKVKIVWIDAFPFEEPEPEEENDIDTVDEETTEVDLEVEEHGGDQAGGEDDEEFPERVARRPPPISPRSAGRKRNNIELNLDLGDVADDEQGPELASKRRKLSDKNDWVRGGDYNNGEVEAASAVGHFDWTGLQVLKDVEFYFCPVNGRPIKLCSGNLTIQDRRMVLINRNGKIEFTNILYRCHLGWCGRVSQSFEYYWFWGQGFWRRRGIFALKRRKPLSVVTGRERDTSMEGIVERAAGFDFYSGDHPGAITSSSNDREVPVSPSIATLSVATSSAARASDDEVEIIETAGSFNGRVARGRARTEMQEPESSKAEEERGGDEFSDEDDDVVIIETAGSNTRRRATRSAVRATAGLNPVITGEDLVEGYIKCPKCGKIICAGEKGCNVFACQNHSPYVFFCIYCKELTEDKYTTCTCPKRNNRLTRTRVQEQKSASSGDSR